VEIRTEYKQEVMGRTRPHKERKKLRGMHRETTRWSHKPPHYNSGGVYKQADGQAHRQKDDLISFLSFFQNKEYALRRE
jgi:hypothetical protein